MVVIGRELDDEEVPDEFPDVGHVPSNERNSFEELQVPSNESQRFVEESESRQELLERLGENFLLGSIFCFLRQDCGTLDLSMCIHI